MLIMKVFMRYLKRLNATYELINCKIVRIKNLHSCKKVVIDIIDESFKTKTTNLKQKCLMPMFFSGSLTTSPNQIWSRYILLIYF